MSTIPEEVTFTPDDRSEVVERMRRMAADRDGWVNIEPILPEGVSVPRQGILGFMGARGPEALMATWVPGKSKGDTVEPTTVGLQHSAGKRVLLRLAEGGLPIPGEWRVTQDHPARGVVATVDDSTDLDDVVAWLVAAAERVATSPLTGRWRATFYHHRA